MTTSRTGEANIAAQAADWFFTLQTDPHKQTEFGMWLRESPRHVEEFLLVSAAYRELDNLPQDTAIDLDAARKAASIVSLSPEDEPFTRQSRRGLSRRYGIAAGIAVTLIATAVWMQWSHAPAGERYVTAIGEIRSFELQDRSVVHLNTASEVQVRYSTGAREVELRDGEASFKVAADPQRPFRVHTDRATIQAIGTEFNVYRRPQGTTVSVLEGKVRVFRTDEPGEGIDVGVGQEVNIGASGTLEAVAQIDPALAVSWRQRRLLFRNEPLAQVAAEFNRYNRTLRIQVDGEVAREKQLTGIFDAGDPESLLLFLSDVPDLTITRSDGEAVIASR